MIIKNKIDSNSAIVVNYDEASVTSGPNAVISTSKDGNYINGPMSFSSNFTKIKFGGIYKFNSLLANTIPSTVITPIPVLEIHTPVKAAAGLASITAMVLGSV